MNVAYFQFWNCAEITIVQSSPTKSPTPTMEPVPTPTPVTSAPTIAAPVKVPTPTPNTGGCCTWNGGLSCGPTWCDATKSNCEGSCNGTYLPGTPTAPISVPSTPVTPTAPVPTSLLTATTTRYWDCRYALYLFI